MLKGKCFVFRKTIVVLVIVTAAQVADAQQVKRSRRITRSFTEPVTQSIAASPEIGIIVDASVKEGDHVRVGDTLARINQRVLRKSLIIAEARAKSTARLDAATSRLNLLKSQLEAVQALIDGGHTNKFEVEQTQAEYENAIAEYRTAVDEHELNQLEVDRIRAQVEDRIIRSPIDGFVTEIHKRLGENVSNNDPRYATIVKVDELKIRFYLETASLNQSRPGTLTTILLGPERTPTQALITYVSPIIDPDSGLGRLDVKIDNRDYRIKSGTICYWGGDKKVPRGNVAVSDSPPGIRDRSQATGQGTDPGTRQPAGVTHVFSDQQSNSARQPTPAARR